MQELNKSFEKTKVDFAENWSAYKEIAANVPGTKEKLADVEGNVQEFEKTMDFSAYEAFAAGHRLALTPKEYELLKLFVTNPGRAFSRDELLEKVWGYEYYGDTRTVDVHIRHLRAKLTEADAALENAIGTVRGVGYRFEL